MSLADLWNNLNVILPLAVLMAGACVLLLVDLIIPAERKGLTALLCALGLVVSLVLVLTQSGAQTAFSGMVTVDGFSRFLQALFLVSGLGGIGIAYNYIKRTGIERGEYYILLVFSIGGMMMMSMSSDLIMVFLSLEWLSIPLYILSAFAHPKSGSEEAGMKYFLLGAYAGGFVLYGVALTFAATGSTNLAAIVAAIQSGSANMILATVGAALILVGLGFKVSAVPFHMWTPDVYEGAPSSVTGFMSVTAKTAGFAALLRIFTLVYPTVAEDLTPIIWVLAALTMILGNLVAIAQRNIKRMLAYSSIAHAGYVMMALVTYGSEKLAADSVASALFYLTAYAFTTLGAWAVVVAMEQAEDKGLQLDDYAGLGARQPLLALCMTIFMLSFTGIPPTLGFVGKFFLFRTAIAGDQIWLAIIGVLTSLISAYYYLRVVVIMYMRPGEAQASRELWVNLVVASSAVLVVVLSLYATPLFTWATQAVVK